MVWAKGKSGNPSGRAIEEKPFVESVRRALAQEDGKRLRQAAEQLLDLAAAGEAWAIEMLADRLDGKAPQEVKVIRETREMSLDDILGELAKSKPARRAAATEAGTGEPAKVH